MTIRIPLAKPEITDTDREAVMQVLRTPHLSMGPKLREFEQAICDYAGCNYAVAVNSGTSALQLAIRALKLKPGAEVILPSFTFSALLNVVLEENLRPRFVDIDPQTYNTTPELIEAAISARTGLILAVHTFGLPMDVACVARIAKLKSRGRSQPIHLIEDACEALGAEIAGRKAGTFAEAGLFAFYPNKQITTGEGGVLVTSDKRIAASAERLRSQGRNPALGWNQHTEIGFSYRLSDINCALGISQLARIENIIHRRQDLAELYDRALSNIPEIARPRLKSEVGQISWFVYPAQLAREFTRKHRDWICDAMLKKGIATGKYFPPLHRQPVLTNAAKMNVGRSPSAVERSDRVLSQKSNLANTEKVADHAITLPFFNQLTEVEIHEVAAALKESIRESRRKM